MISTEDKRRIDRVAGLSLDDLPEVISKNQVGGFSELDIVLKIANACLISSISKLKKFPEWDDWGLVGDDLEGLYMQLSSELLWLDDYMMGSEREKLLYWAVTGYVNAYDVINEVEAATLTPATMLKAINMTAAIEMQNSGAVALLTARARSSQMGAKGKCKSGSKLPHTTLIQRIYDDLATKKQDKVTGSAVHNRLLYMLRNERVMLEEMINSIPGGEPLHSLTIKGDGTALYTLNGKDREIKQGTTEGAVSKYLNGERNES